MKILKSLSLVVAVAAVAGGATYAYFSATATASGTINTGTITVSLLNQNSETEFSPFTISNMYPGSTKQVEFDVKNTSSADKISIRGAAYGTWAGSFETNFTPDNTLLKIVQVERYNGSGWTTLIGDGNTAITGLFTDPYDVDTNGRAQYRLTVKLDGAAGNEYQNKTYNASIKIQAKQGEIGWEQYTF